jgi:hypothetical protein
VLIGMGLLHGFFLGVQAAEGGQVAIERMVGAG